MQADSDPANDDWIVSRGQLRSAFWILLVAALLISRIGAYCWNHGIQIAFVNWLNDRSLYPQDPYTAVLARYPFGMWSLVASFARIVPLEGMLRALYVLDRLFLLYAAGRLARAFAPRSRLAVVAGAALFALPIDSMIGGGTIVASAFEQTALAVACILMGATAFHERRRVAWAFWLGAAFELTPMYGVFASSYFGAEFLVDREYRKEWKRWLLPCILFLALSSYALVVGFSIARGPSTIDPSWFPAALARGAGHLYPWTWGWAFARFGAFIVLFTTVMAFVRPKEPRLFRHGVVWSVVAVAWLIEAIVAAYVLRSPPLMMMQPARATDLLLCFGGIAMIAVASARLEKPRESGGRQGWLLALGASFLVWLVPGGWPIGAVLALAALPPLWRRLAPWVSPRRVAWFLVVGVALVGVQGVRIRWAASGDLGRTFFRGPHELTRTLAAWAEKNTPVDAVFLLNPVEEPDFDQFRALAKRSIFTSPDEGAGIYWAADFAPEWTRRLEALGMKVEYRDAFSLDDDFSAAFGDLDDDDVWGLKERYRVSYWVVSDAQPSRFPVVWTGDGFKVLDVR